MGKKGEKNIIVTVIIVVIAVVVFANFLVWVSKNDGKLFANKTETTDITYVGNTVPVTREFEAGSVMKGDELQKFISDKLDNGMVCSYEIVALDGSLTSYGCTDDTLTELSDTDISKAITDGLIKADSNYRLQVMTDKTTGEMKKALYVEEKADEK